MLGPDILVCPVVELGKRTRPVYLPKGTDWTNAWTGEALRGGQTLEATAPIDRIPVFVRAGAAVRTEAWG